MRLVVSLLAAIAMATTVNAAGLAPTDKDRTALHWAAQEIEIAHVLDTLKSRAHAGTTVISDVSVVDVVNSASTRHQTVIVRDGKIAWIGNAADAPQEPGAFMVDGTGRYLAPGLTDMHVHTVSLQEQVLRLAVGNTSVRDMDGFPWMLELRRAIQSGRLLAPNAYIAGTIITSTPLGGYSVVVKTEAEARETVRKQAACGYDFIKVHNILGLALFDAVADETRRVGMDLVGHIPHNITIDHAIHSGGMRTLEHLKGFITDNNLIVSDEDYATAVAGAKFWQTPTFYTDYNFRAMANKDALLQKPEMKYVPLRRRNAWAALQMTDKDKKLEGLLDVATPAAMKRLLPLHQHWLAGTDAANYPTQVPGFALLDELDLMEDAGITRADTIRGATSEPAAAMRQSEVFGQVRRGMRADLVLLDADPMQVRHAYRNNHGVMLRGMWLARSDLDAALAQLAAIEAEPDASYAVNAKSIRATEAAAMALARDHIVFDQRRMTPFSTALRDLGHADMSANIDRVMASFAQGACAEITPTGGDGD